MILVSSVMGRPKPRLPLKGWEREQVEELADLAKRKGISKDSLAREWLGVFPSTLTYWLTTSKSYREPTDMARRLLSYVEQEIAKLKDWD